MKEYDVVVVGGGPAGSSAARAAAQNGARVVLLEEHPAIGLPRHCSGMFADSGFTREIRELIGDDRFVVRELKGWKTFAPSGKLIQEFPLGDRGACIISRERYDRELARLAANAGADIVLNTRVTGILKKNGNIAGVTTSSRTMPEVQGKVVIAAGGFHALRNGITYQEGLARPDEFWANGIQMELTRVKGMEPGVAEFYTGSIVPQGWTTFYPTDETTCWGTFKTLEAFEQMKAKNHVLSEKLRDAIPIFMGGYIVPHPMGRGLPKYVEDGLMIIGSAAHFNGNIVAFITGRWAGEVAAEAVKEGDVSEAKLSKYVDKFREIDLEHEYDYWIDFLPKAKTLPEDELETMMQEMVKRGEKIMTRVQLPF